jgi:hypothetical protein
LRQDFRRIGNQYHSLITSSNKHGLIYAIAQKIHFLPSIIHYPTFPHDAKQVVPERNELHDDNRCFTAKSWSFTTSLVRQQSDPIWSQDSTRSALAASYPTSRVFPVQHSPHLPVITATALPLQPVITQQSYAAPPRELQLFPEVSSASTEDSELSQDQGLSNSVARPQARYPTPAVLLSPVNQFPILPRMGEEQQYSSGTSEEHSLHRV